MFHSVEVARTHEILSRFRPIAPKPSLPQPHPLVPTSSSVALHLGSRPCRARKRGRHTPSPLPFSKRQKTFLPILPSAAPPPAPRMSPATYPAVVPFSFRHCETSGGNDLMTLSLLSRSPEPETDAPAPVVVPVEQDLLQKLQEPRVIMPQPLRPVGSTISVGCISELDTSSCAAVTISPALVSKRSPEEVEEEVESDALPAVISDSRNRVRLANSAYKEMVGQPECPWLDAMIASSAAGAGLRLRPQPRRISGEVMLAVEESSVPKSSNGFSCRVKIEWACNGRKNYVDTPCKVIRLFCKSKDYFFAWRFQTKEASVTYCSA